MRLALAIVLVAACSSGSKRPDAAPTPAASANEYLQRTPLTFVVGTAGDDRADRGIAAQVSMIRDTLFPTAEVVRDADITTWPANAIVYGGPHVSSVVQDLPFTLAPGRLEIGGQTFAGDEFQIITLVPATADRPQFLLYAGTGTPGVAEINSGSGGGAAITIKDVFGIVQTGRWEDGRPVLDPPARRINWRSVERGDVTVRFPADLPGTSAEPEQISAILRGVGTSQIALGSSASPRMTFYVYPDIGAKKSLTGNPGYGNALVEARALHVIAVDAANLERLTAHEATHVLAYHTWGPPGTSLLGEGLAVWAAKGYQGKPLDAWATTVEPHTIDDLLKSFRKLPENVGYPLGGILVDVAIGLVGIDNVRAHLYAATSSTWADACRAAGTSPEALEAAFAARVRPAP
jgi:hypothetical protein